MCEISRQVLMCTVWNIVKFIWILHYVEVQMDTPKTICKCDIFCILCYSYCSSYCSYRSWSVIALAIAPAIMCEISRQVQMCTVWNSGVQKDTIHVGGLSGHFEDRMNNVTSVWTAQYSLNNPTKYVKNINFWLNNSINHCITF